MRVMNMQKLQQPGPAARAPLTPCNVEQIQGVLFHRRDSYFNLSESYISSSAAFLDSSSLTGQDLQESHM